MGDGETIPDISRLIPLGAVAARLGVHLTTVCSWADRGSRGVRLRHCRVGSRRFTTEEWLAEFFRGTNAEPVNPTPPH